MNIHSVLFAVVFVLGGCTSVRDAPSVADRNATSEGISICDLVAHGLAQGQTARIAATYMTDGSHYAYLLNRGCGKDGVLNVGDMEPITQESVKRFYDAGEQRCAKSGTPYLCVLKANIDANIEIVRDQDGQFAAKLLKVHKFSFIEPSS